MRIERFEELDIWKEARELCQLIRDITSEKGLNQDYKFRDQIRGSSGSIMDNIAEGFERDGKKEFIQFLSVAKGSCGETRSQCYRALDYGYIDQEQFNMVHERTIQISKKTSTLIKYLKSTEISGLKYKKPET